MEMFNEEPTCDLFNTYSVNLTGEYCAASFALSDDNDDEGHAGGDWQVGANFVQLQIP